MSRSQNIVTIEIITSSRMIHTNPDQAIIDLSLNQDDVVAHAYDISCVNPNFEGFARVVYGFSVRWVRQW